MQVQLKDIALKQVRFCFSVVLFLLYLCFIHCGKQLNITLPMDEKFTIKATYDNDTTSISVAGMIEIADSEELRKSLIQKMKDAQNVNIAMNLKEDVNLPVLQVLMSAANIPEKNVSVTLSVDDDQKSLIENAGLDNFIEIK